MYDTSIKNWTTILHVAEKYGFPQVKALAIREVDKLSMSPISRLVFYRDHMAPPERIHPLLVELCSRPQPLSNEEFSRLGIPLAAPISRAREFLVASPGGASYDEIQRLMQKLLIDVGLAPSGSTASGMPRRCDFMCDAHQSTCRRSCLRKRLCLKTQTRRSPSWPKVAEPHCFTGVF